MNRLAIELPPSTKLLAPTRSMINAWLCSGSAADDRWGLIATELIANAISFTSEDGMILVVMEQKSDNIELQVSDFGPGFDPTEVRMAAADSVRGRGLGLVKALTTQFEAVREGNKTTIIVSHPLP